MSLIVIAHNVTPDLARPDGTADYEVEVSVNRKRFLWIGKVLNHRRASGAAKLLRRIAKEMDDAKDHSAEPAAATESSIGSVM